MQLGHVARAVRSPRAAAAAQPEFIRVEPASRFDLAALIALEQAAFAGDRISPRSWRSLIASPSATVAHVRDASTPHEVLGAAVVLWLETRADNPTAQQLFIRRYCTDSPRKPAVLACTQGANSMASDIKQIATWLQPQDILLGVDLRDRDQALEFVSAQIGRVHGLDAAPIFRALWRREQAASTALGEGVAIPHARIGGITRPLTLYMRTKSPLAFGAPDSGPVSQLLVIMVPADGANDDHLQLLALVARLFSDRVFRTELDNAQDPTAAANAFRAGAARLTPESS